MSSFVANLKFLLDLLLVLFILKISPQFVHDTKVISLAATVKSPV